MATSLNRWVLAACLFTGSATVVVPIFSANAAELDKKAKADAKEATALYKEGRYEDAAKIFLRLSVAYPDTTVFVRNLGACYYYLRRADPALSNLRDYLHKKKNIEPDDRAEVERWIAEMDKLRSEPSPSAPAPSPAPVPAVAPVPAAPAPVEGPPPPSAYPPPSSPDQGMPPQGQWEAAPPAPSPVPGTLTGAAPAPATTSYKTVGWALGIGGLAGIGVGGVFTALALDKFSAVEKKYDPAMEKDGKAYARYQFIAYGVGGVCLVTGILLATMTPSAPAVALTPTASGTGVMGTWQGHF